MIYNNGSETMKRIKNRKKNFQKKMLNWVTNKLYKTIWLMPNVSKEK